MVTKNKNLAQNILSIFYAIPESVESELVGSTSYHRKIIFKEGYDWEEIPFSPKSGKFTEKTSSKAAGVLYKPTLNAFYPGEDESDLALFAKITNRPVLIKLVYSSAQCKLIGNLSGAKPRLLPSLAVGTGKTGRALKFTGNDIHTAYWLEE